MPYTAKLWPGASPSSNDGVFVEWEDGELIGTTQIGFFSPFANKSISPRSMEFELKDSSTGAVLGVVTVFQEGRSRAFSAAFSPAFL